MEQDRSKKCQNPSESAIKGEFRQMLSKFECKIDEFRENYPDDMCLIKQQCLQFLEDLERSMFQHFTADLDPNRLQGSSLSELSSPDLQEGAPSYANFFDGDSLFPSANDPNNLDFSMSNFPLTLEEEQLPNPNDSQHAPDSLKNLCSADAGNVSTNGNGKDIGILLTSDCIREFVNPDLLTQRDLVYQIHRAGDRDDPEKAVHFHENSEGGKVSIRNKRPKTRKTSDASKETPSNYPNKRQKPQPGSTKITKRSTTKHAGRVPEEQLVTFKDISTKLQAFLESLSAEEYTDNLQVLVEIVLSLQGELPLLHLRKTLLAIREKVSIPHDLACKNFQSTVSKLEDLDSLAATCSVLRRWYCVVLREQKDIITQEFINKKQNPDFSRKKNKRGSGKISTSVINHLMEHVRTSSNRCRGNGLEYKRKRIKNWLAIARNWQWVRTDLSIGMLFFIPTSGDSGVTDQEFENLPTPLVALLFKFIIHEYGDNLLKCGEAISQHLKAILEGKDVDKKFELEVVSEDALRRAAMDPAELLQLCKLHDEGVSGTGCNIGSSS